MVNLFMENNLRKKILTTSGDHWRTLDDYWSTSEYRLASSDDFWWHL